MGREARRGRLQSAIPLSEVGAATASDDDKTRLDLHLNNGDFAIRLETEEAYPSVDEEEGGGAHHTKRMSFMADDTETFAEVARRATSELPPTPPKTNAAALDRARARRASQSDQTDIWGNPRKQPAA